MKNQVLSIEKMQHLIELSVDTSEASAVLMLYTENGEELGWNEVENHGKNKPLYEWYNNETETWESAHTMIYDAEMGDYDHSYKKECGTFTLQDMLEIMPKFIRIHNSDDHKMIIRRKYNGSWIIEYEGEVKCENDLLTAAYNMLCWLAEKKLLGNEEKK